MPDLIPFDQGYADLTAQGASPEELLRFTENHRTAFFSQYQFTDEGERRKYEDLYAKERLKIEVDSGVRFIPAGENFVNSAARSFSSLFTDMWYGFVNTDLDAARRHRRIMETKFPTREGFSADLGEVGGQLIPSAAAILASGGGAALAAGGRATLGHGIAKLGQYGALGILSGASGGSAAIQVREYEDMYGEDIGPGKTAAVVTGNMAAELIGESLALGSALRVSKRAAATIGEDFLKKRASRELTRQLFSHPNGKKVLGAALGLGEVGLVNAGQEMATQVMQNVVNKMYDPESGAFDNVLEAGYKGFLGGAMLGPLSLSVGGAQTRRQRDGLVAEESEFLDKFKRQAGEAGVALDGVEHYGRNAYESPVWATVRERLGRLNVSLIPVRGMNEQVGKRGAFYQVEGQDVALVDLDYLEQTYGADSGMMSAYVAGHEGAHGLISEDAGVESLFLDMVQEDTAEFQEYAEKWAELSNEELTGDPLQIAKVKRELVADFFGTQWMSPEFQDKLIDRDPKAAKSFIQKLLEVARVEVEYDQEAGDQLGTAAIQAIEAQGNYNEMVDAFVTRYKDRSIAAGVKFATETLGTQDQQVQEPVEQPPEDVELPEGYRWVAPDEVIPTGDFNTIMNFQDTGFNATNAPAQEVEFSPSRRGEPKPYEWTSGKWLAETVLNEAAEKPTDLAGVARELEMVANDFLVDDIALALTPTDVQQFTEAVGAELGVEPAEVQSALETAGLNLRDDGAAADPRGVDRGSEPPPGQQPTAEGEGPRMVESAISSRRHRESQFDAMAVDLYHRQISDPEILEKAANMSSEQARNVLQNLVEAGDTEIAMAFTRLADDMLTLRSSGLHREANQLWRTLGAASTSIARALRAHQYFYFDAAASLEARSAKRVAEGVRLSAAKNLGVKAGDKAAQQAATDVQMVIADLAGKTLAEKIAMVPKVVRAARTAIQNISKSALLDDFGAKATKEVVVDRESPQFGDLPEFSPGEGSTGPETRSIADILESMSEKPAEWAAYFATPGGQKFWTEVLSPELAEGAEFQSLDALVEFLNVSAEAEAELDRLSESTDVEGLEGLVQAAAKRKSRKKRKSAPRQTDELKALVKRLSKLGTGELAAVEETVRSLEDLQKEMQQRAENDAPPEPEQDPDSKPERDMAVDMAGGKKRRRKVKPPVEGGAPQVVEPEVKDEIRVSEILAEKVAKAHEAALRAGEDADPAEKIVKQFLQEAESVARENGAFPERPESEKLTAKQILEHMVNNPAAFTGIIRNTQERLREIADTIEDPAEAEKMREAVQDFVERWIYEPYSERDLNRYVDEALKAQEGDDFWTNSEFFFQSVEDLGTWLDEFASAASEGLDILEPRIPERELADLRAQNEDAARRIEADHLEHATTPVEEIRTRLREHIRQVIGDRVLEKRKKLLDAEARRGVGRKVLEALEMPVENKNVANVIARLLENAPGLQDLLERRRAEVLRTLRERDPDGYDLARQFYEEMFDLAKLKNEVLDARMETLIREQMRKLDTTFAEAAKEYFNHLGDGTVQERVLDALRDAGLPPSLRPAAAERVKGIVETRLAEARQKALKELEARRKNLSESEFNRQQKFLNRVSELIQLGALDQVEYEALVAERLGLPKVTEESKKYIREQMAKIKEAEKVFGFDSAEVAVLSKQLNEHLIRENGLKAMDKYLYLYYAGILSGPRTWLLVNPIGSATKSSSEAFERTLVALLRKNIQPSDVIPLVKAFSRGFKGSWANMRSVFADNFSGLRMDEKWREFTQDRVAPFTGSVTKHLNVLGIVGKLIQAGDVPFYNAAREFSMALDTIVKLRADGVDTDTPEGQRKLQEELKLDMDAEYMARAREDFTAAGRQDVAHWRVKRRAQELRLADMERTTVESGDLVAAISTYTGRTGGIARMIGRQLGELKRQYPALSIFFPFTNIVAAVVDSTFAYAPLLSAWHIHGARKDVKAISGGTRVSDVERRRAKENLDLAYVKSLIGYGTMLGLLAAALRDDDEEDAFVKITGAGPRDWKKNAQWRQQGGRPYTLTIGGTNLSYMQHPLFAVLATLGALSDNVKFEPESFRTMVEEGKVPEAGMSALFLLSLGGVSATLDQSFLKGVSDLMELLIEPDPNRKVQKFADTFAQTTTNAIPASNFLRQVEGMVNNTRPFRSAEITGNDVADTVIAAFLSRAPVLRSLSALPENVNALGTPVRVDRPILSNLAVWDDGGTDDPVDREIFNFLVKHRVYLSVPSPSYTGKIARSDLTKVEQLQYTDEDFDAYMNGDEYIAFMKERGARFKEAFIASYPTLVELADTGDREALKDAVDKIMRESQRMAKRSLLGLAATKPRRMRRRRISSRPGSTDFSLDFSPPDLGLDLDLDLF